MNDRSNRTVICSIAFLDIVDYSRRVGQEQVVLKERFNGLIGEVVKDIAQNDRVLIDTGDGAALCFMGDPEDALFVVMNLRDRLRTPENEAIDLKVRIGINLGPVRMIHDINDRPNVIGDGINVAQRVMSFAEPNQIMVSRSYFEVVSRLSQEYTQLFNYAGARKDKHVREHEVYEVGPGNDDAADVAEPAAPTTSATPPPQPAATAVPAGDATTTIPGSRNKSLAVGAIAAVIVLAIAIFAAVQFKGNKAGEASRAETPAQPAQDAAPPPVAGTPAAIPDAEMKGSVPVVGSPTAAKSDAASNGGAAKSDAASTGGAAKTKAAQAEPSKTPPQVAGELPVDTKSTVASKNDARKTSVATTADKKAIGTLEFWVNPWGEVFIDGKQVGTSPPLKVHKLPVGIHQVEIVNDNAGFPYKKSVEVKADEVLRINQTFR